MSKLDVIREWLITAQQNMCFLNYEYQVYDFGRHPSRRDFIEFYKLWIYNQKLKNDFTESQIDDVFSY